MLQIHFRSRSNHHSCFQGWSSLTETKFCKYFPVSCFGVYKSRSASWKCVTVSSLHEVLTICKKFL
uniref:Uncharacterized protein n=1 Tax=Anguilla anguilla TaxID=7936 RepID=A0A0E9WNU9_ANGAN